jgi:RNA polymerase sigma-70 factor (sigma-E family)
MGEPETFEDFVRGCAHRLYRVACLLASGDRGRAEDLVAEALARVYLAWPRLRAGDAYGYARRTLVNLHTDWWRISLRRREVITDRPPETAGDALIAAAHGDLAGDVARRDSVTRSLGRLTRRERAVVVLRYFTDLSERDTAAELGISVGTVKSANARALAKLRVAPELDDAVVPARHQEA